MKIRRQKYFKVIAKCGHVGRNKYIPISFAVKAESKIEASQKVLTFPRVKKQLKDAIISCEEVCKRTYKEIIKNNQHNPYLKSKCNKDNNFFDIEIMKRVNIKEIHYKKKIEPPLSMKYRRAKYDNGGSFNCLHLYFEEDFL